MRKKFLLFIILPLCLFSFSSVTHAVTLNISASLPGVQPTDCSNPANYGSTACTPATFINGLYLFALSIGGILAFGAIVWGGFKYITAAGNPSGQSDGKEWIESALLGLLLLAGAWLILHTVNPQLVTLQIAAVPATTAPSATGGGTTNGTGATCGILTCASGSQCLTDVNGNNYCQSFAQNNSTNPVCRGDGLPAGCALWTAISPTPSGCAGYGGVYTCVTGAPPSNRQCYSVTNC